MHRLDPTTTVLTAAPALMTAFALASETPFAGVRGRVSLAAPSGAPVRIVAPGDGWVALSAAGVGALPPLAIRRR